MASVLEMLALPETYSLPEGDEGKVRTILRLAAREDGGPEIPEEVVRSYLTLKRCMDRLGAPMTDVTVSLAVFMAAQIPQDAKPEFTQQHAGLPKGTAVQFRFRGKWVAAEYVGKNADGTLRVDHKGEMRDVPESDVRLPSAAEDG